MSGHCSGCGNTMCLCDECSSDNVVASGVMITDERYEHFIQLESQNKIMREALDELSSSANYNYDIWAMNRALAALAEVDKLKGN